MSVPNLYDLVVTTKDDYPEAWRCAHTGQRCTHDFIKILAARAHQVDPKFGLLGQRGDATDLAEDALLYIGEGPGHDPTHGNTPVTGIDVIVGAGGPTPQPGWGVIPTGGPAAWVKPATVTPPGPTPPTPQKPPYPPYSTGWGDDATGNRLSAALDSDYKRAGRTGMDAGSGAWFWRTAYDASKDIYDNGTAPNVAMDASIAKHRAEWCAALGIPVPHQL